MKENTVSACDRLAADFAAPFLKSSFPGSGLPADSLEHFAASLQEKGLLPDHSSHGALSGPAERMFFARMLYSCAVDAQLLTQAPQEPSEFCTMAQLEQTFNQFADGWYPPVGELNRLRWELLEHCRREGPRCRPGLYTLTAPTGSGKTTASLAFALAHARSNKLRRVIYVVPYTSIIDHTAQVFRSILGNEQVLEHHSGLLCAAKQGVAISPQAAENWDMPVVVTTAVEFFQSLYADCPARCRRLHNIADSVIIFDEAQMLPIAHLRPCLWAVSQLVKHFGVTALHCTAARPALDPFIRSFLPDAEITELCPPDFSNDPAFLRSIFRREGKLSWDELAERVNRRKQVLCVVNSRRSARELFRRMRGEGCFHLSTLMYPAHRQAMLGEIHRRLAEKLPCHVVSTSLVEAGLDLDFPTVFREEAGLDSILQSAGRCNREGRNPREDSVVTVFQTQEPVPSIFLPTVEAGREAMKYHSDLDMSQALDYYFLQLLELKSDSELDQAGVLSAMEEQPFHDVTERFRMIDSPIRTVFIPLGEGAALAERLRAGERSQQLLRQLGRYGVTVFQWQFSTLEKAGLLDVLEDGTAVLRVLGIYEQNAGLSSSEERIAGLVGQ